MMSCRLTVTTLVLVLLLPGSVRLALAQNQQVAPPSLDDALFGDLGQGSVDPGVEKELFGEDPTGPGKKDAAKNDPLSARRIEAWNDLLEKELGQSAVDEARNPLLGIARSMRLVEGLIDENRSGKQTQDIQADIITDLDALLKQAKKKCQSCSSQCQSVAQRKPTEQPKPSQPKEGSSNPKPATTSNAKPGKADGKTPDMAEMMAVIKQVWGELPEKERQQMLQSSVEEFLPKYAELIEQYYRRLAEGRKEPR